MSHDQLFKELLQAFFQEFMELFYPKVAARLDFARVTFLDKEMFTDLPQGEQREADLVAQVYTLEGLPEIILTHIEVEARRRGSFPARMCEYYWMLRLRHRLPIFPIVVYLSPGAGGLTPERHVESVFDYEVNVFSYQAVGLPDLNADDYQTIDNPLGPALSALMKTSRLGKVAQKYHSLRAMARSRIDEARKALLTNVIETYLTLEADEQVKFKELIAAPEGKEVSEMISIYEQRGIEKGIEQGIEKGIEQGIEQGIVRGKRDSLLRQMRLKFGGLPDQARKHIESLVDMHELDRLTDRVLQASNLDEMQLTTA
jgi:hypothetical protein